MTNKTNFILISFSLLSIFLTVIFLDLSFRYENYINAGKILIKEYKTIENYCTPQELISQYVHKLRERNDLTYLNNSHDFTIFNIIYTFLNGSTYNVSSTKDANKIISIRFTKLKENYIDKINKEEELYKHLTENGFPYIPPYLFSFNHDGFNILYTICQSGELLSHILSNNEILTYDFLFSIISRIYSILDILHETYNIYHGSLSINDILIRDKSIKIINYPFSNNLNTNLSAEECEVLRNYIKIKKIPNNKIALDILLFKNLLMDILSYENVQKIIIHNYNTNTFCLFLQIKNTLETINWDNEQQILNAGKFLKNHLIIN